MISSNGTNRQIVLQPSKQHTCGRHSSVVCLRLRSDGPGFKSQPHHLRFYQFVLFKSYRENNEHKQKEAGIGPFKKTYLGNWSPLFGAFSHQIAINVNFVFQLRQRFAALQLQRLRGQDRIRPKGGESRRRRAKFKLRNEYGLELEAYEERGVTSGWRRHGSWRRRRWWLRRPKSKRLGPETWNQCDQKKIAKCL